MNVNLAATRRSLTDDEKNTSSADRRLGQMLINGGAGGDTPVMSADHRAVGHAYQGNEGVPDGDDKHEQMEEGAELETDRPESASLEADELIRLNVGGRRFVLRAATLRNRTNSGLLARFVQRSHEQRLTIADAYIEWGADGADGLSSGEYFFERSPLMFDLIYDFYVTGHLHVPAEHCLERYLLEIQFWRIPQRYIATCCDKYGLRPQPDVHPAPQEVVVKSEYEGLYMSRIRQMLSVYFDHPNSSAGAKWVALLTVSLIVTSVVGMILGSLKEYQQPDGRPHQALLTIEWLCIIYFTAEFVIRFTISVHKWNFLKDVLNLIDLFTIVPYYFERLLERTMAGAVAGNLSGVMLALRVVRVFKIVRLFKLVRYSNPLQLIGATLVKSAKELSFLGLVLLVGVVFFSTVMYFIEGGGGDARPGHFDSIPASAWWTVITMTTIGYGDVVPVTVGGKLVASVASVCGIIVLAFPISMLVENFSRQHHRIARISHAGTAALGLASDTEHHHQPQRDAAALVNVGHKISKTQSQKRKVRFSGKTATVGSSSPPTPEAECLA